MDDPGDKKDVREQRFVDPFLGAARVCALGVVAVITAVVLNVDRSQLTAETLTILVPVFALGLVGPFFFFHPFRVLGLCPPGVLLVEIAVTTSWALGDWPTWTLMLVAFGCGVVVGAVLRYERAILIRQVSHRVVMRNVDRATLLLLPALVIGICFAGPTDFPLVSGSLWFLAIALLAHTWTRLFRPFFELGVEAAVWRGYRVAAGGAGVDQIPTRGPLLVIANHACWWDPLFLAKVLPRPVTPMMTSAFYDRWFLKPLMVCVFQTIRVADVRIRREAPEIAEAIRALDEGKCVVIFPEGYLRRKEEAPLRRFGRGIWEILKARPETPVLACWIEGSWGSYASYWNGPPTKNKQPERRRPIAVGISPPLIVSTSVLHQHLQTRIALMNEVVKARANLALPELPLFETVVTDEVEKSAQE